MAETKVINGWEYVKVPGGWQRGRQVGGPPADPTFEHKGPLAAGQVANTNANTGRTKVQTQGDITDNQTKRATQPAVVREANAKAAAAEVAAAAAAAERDGKRKQLDEFGNIINSLTDQYYKSFKGAGGSSGRGRLAEYLPAAGPFGKSLNSTNNLFDSTAKRAGPFLKPVLFPGGKDTDAASEYQQKIMPFIPQSGDDDETMADKIKQLRRIYEGQAKAAGLPPRTTAGAPRKQAPVIDFNQWGK
ncbi:MAG: hypothetical protein RIS17_1532 [Pseudomonadota bacterium]|jgi:hypothetical protein